MGGYELHREYENPDSRTIKEKELNQNTNFNLIPSTPYSPLKQLFLVLPKESLISILNNIYSPHKIEKLKRTLFKNEKLYPNKLYIDLIHKKYLWLLAWQLLR